MSGQTPLGEAVINVANVAQPANYLVFDGLEVDGNNNNAGGPCIAVSAAHHIVVENSLIHGCGESGLGFGQGEYYWFVNNTVYKNCANYSASGIDIYHPDLATVYNPSFVPNANDQALYYHIVVANNIAHDNITTLASASHTDGNGIIFDDFDHYQTWTDPLSHALIPSQVSSKEIFYTITAPAEF
jgi:hypothetical protein